VREVSSAFVEIWVGRFYVRSRLLKGWLKVYERPVDIFAHQVFARLSGTASLKAVAVFAEDLLQRLPTERW
jgi:hypothetical protein